MSEGTRTNDDKLDATTGLCMYACSADQMLEIDALRYTFMQDGDVYSA